MSSSKTINISPQLFNIKPVKPVRKKLKNPSNKDTKAKLMNRLRHHMSTQKNHKTSTERLSKFESHMSYFQKLNKEKKKTRSRNRTENVHAALPASMNVTTELTNSVSPYSVNIKAAPEYGILKGTTKPTMREWKRKTQKAVPQDVQIKPSSAPIVCAEIKPSSAPIVCAEIKPLSAPIVCAEIKPSSASRAVRPAVRKTFLLGKRKDKIGVLIKNNSTRKRIKDEINILNDAPMYDVKAYLKNHQLYKAGNNTPHDLLREIYKSAHLAGKPVKNKSAENLLHNFYKL